MIVRADFGRGLANQTYSFWSHLAPEVTVVVNMAMPRYPFPQNPEMYPGAIVTDWKGYTAPFENPEAVEALRSCDLIYTAETYYDPRLESIPAILHVNPEMYRGERAAQYWYPTTWLTDSMPPGEIVPTPLPDEDIATEVAGPGKLLHVGGNHAVGDRNGARIVHGTVNQVPHPWRLTSQNGMKLSPRALQYAEVRGYVDDRWELYEGCSMLVYPRRYGGQSLQVNEAMAKGLAVLMTSCEPNIATWPVIPLECRQGGRVKTPGGTFPMYQAHPNYMRDTITTLLDDQDLLEKWQAESLAWARDNAWSQWLPKIEALIGR